MYLLFDTGGTKTRLAVSKDEKNLEEVKIFPTPQGFAEGIELLTTYFTPFLQNNPKAALCGGIAGTFDKEKTQLLKSPNLPQWAQQPLKETLEKELGIPVYLENDAALAGLGEANQGAGKSYKIVAFLTIGTGVGGARIVQGKIDEKSLGFEPGHQIVDEGGNLCSCGGQGHLEAYISGTAIAKIYGQKAEDIKDPKVWDEVSKWLSLGLNNLIVDWSPDVIVLGGSVTQSIPLGRVQSHLKKILKTLPQPPVVKGTLKEAGLHGALEYLKQINPPVS